MIEAWLDKIDRGGVSQEALISMRNSMCNTTQLAMTLQQHNSLSEVLHLLYAEVTGQARPSYMARIYGRYRVLSGERDKEAIDLWRMARGKSGKQSGDLSR